MNENAIVCSNLSIAQGEFGMENISLEIKRGYITGLIGRNGSGKTTLLKGIAGVLDATNNNVVIDDLSYRTDEPEIRKIISVMYDKVNFSKNRKPKTLAEEISLFERDFDMSYFTAKMMQLNLNIDKKIFTYSEGMFKKLMLILALSRRPQILILDEPTSGVDPVSRIEMLDLIQEFMEDETHTVLFSTHITTDLDKIADYIILVDQGKVAFLKEKEELITGYKSTDTLPSIEEVMCDWLKERGV